MSYSSQLEPGDHHPNVSAVTANRLRIVHVVEAAFAGVGRHVLDLGRGQVDRGHEVHVVVARRRASAEFSEQLLQIDFASISSVEGATGRWMDVRGCQAVQQIVAATSPDILHGHASRGGAWARIGRSGRTRVVYTPNAMITQSPTLHPLLWHCYRSVERTLARRTDLLIHVSAEEAEHAREIGVRAKGETLIPNGIPLVELPSRADARRRLGLPCDGLLVGFVGRLVPQKGLELLIDASRQVYDATGATIVVVGEGPDREALAQYAERQNAGPIRWIGKQPGQLVMPAFDVFALPSRYEGFPYVLLESLWAGVPVVATDSSCASAVLGDGRAGTLTPRDPEVFGRAIVRLLSECSSDLRSRAARSRAISLSVDKMVDSTLASYDALG